MPLRCEPLQLRVVRILRAVFAFKRVKCYGTLQQKKLSRRQVLSVLKQDWGNGGKINN